MTFALKGPYVPLFVKCLGALPNLHTLEIAEFDNSATEKLRIALQGIELSQIKTLILPPPAHPFLEHCRGAEDVVCVATRFGAQSGAFFRSLTSNRDSKVRRLVIPLIGWRKGSRKSRWTYCMVAVWVGVTADLMTVERQDLHLCVHDLPS